MKRESMASVVGLLAAGTFAVYGLGPNGWINGGGFWKAKAETDEALPLNPTISKKGMPPPSAPEAEKPALATAEPVSSSAPLSGTAGARELDAGTVEREFYAALLKYGITKEEDVRMAEPSENFRKTAIYHYAGGWMIYFKERQKEGMPACAITGFDAAGILAFQMENIEARIAAERQKAPERQFLGMTYEGKTDAAGTYRSATRPSVNYGMGDAKVSCETGRYFSENRLSRAKFFPEE